MFFRLKQTVQNQIPMLQPYSAWNSVYGTALRYLVPAISCGLKTETRSDFWDLYGVFPEFQMGGIFSPRRFRPIAFPRFQAIGLIAYHRLKKVRTKKIKSSWWKNSETVRPAPFLPILLSKPANSLNDVVPSADKTDLHDLGFSRGLSRARERSRTKGAAVSWAMTSISASEGSNYCLCHSVEHTPISMHINTHIFFNFRFHLMIKSVLESSQWDESIGVT